MDPYRTPAPQDRESLPPNEEHIYSHGQLPSFPDGFRTVLRVDYKRDVLITVLTRGGAEVARSEISRAWYNGLSEDRLRTRAHRTMIYDCEESAWNIVNGRDPRYGTMTLRVR